MQLVKATSVIIIALTLFISLPSEAQSAKQELNARRKEWARVEKLTKLVNSGNSDSAFQLGNLYIHGWSITPKIDSALKYLVIAQQHGSPEAMYQFGLWYESGVPELGSRPGGSPDAAQALIWFQNAAAKGHGPAKERVIEYQKASNGRAEADSLLQIGKYAEALPVLMRIAKYKHDTRAMYQVAQIYRNGTVGVPASTSEYKHWLLMAGDNYYQAAARELATMYESMGARFEDDTRYWYTAASRNEPNDAVLVQKRDYYDEVYKRRTANAEAMRREAAGLPVQYGARPVQGTATTTRTRCANCNGTGKVTSRYTSEKRNWTDKTITLTDHSENKTCNFCNGTGWLP